MYPFVLAYVKVSCSEYIRIAKGRSISQKLSSSSKGVPSSA